MLHTKQIYRAHIPSLRYDAPRIATKMLNYCKNGLQQHRNSVDDFITWNTSFVCDTVKLHRSCYGVIIKQWQFWIW